MENYITRQELKEFRNDLKNDIYNGFQNVLQSFMGSMPLNLESCTGYAQNAPEGGIPTAYERTRVYIGQDENGKPRYTQVSGRTQDERNDAIVAAYFESGRINEFQTIYQPKAAAIDSSKHPFTEYAQEWYGRFKSHLRPTTDVTQRGWLKQLCKHFKDTPIESIDVSCVQDYVNTIQQNTTGTIVHKVTFLGEIFNAAVEDDLIAKNPTKSRRIQLGGKEGKGIQALPKETIKELIERIRNAPDRQIQLWLAILLYTGLRREELLGLRWEDIDFTSGILHIERSITYSSSKPELGPPKTPKSRRHIAMPDELIAVLKPLKRKKGYLIADRNGKPYDEGAVNDLREAVRDYVGLPELDARELRHSYASMLHAAGVEVRAIGACLGHTKSDTTDRYIQVETSRLIDVRNAGINYVIGT